jgi:hypothetical protein
MMECSTCFDRGVVGWPGHWDPCPKGCAVPEGVCRKCFAFPAPHYGPGTPVHQPGMLHEKDCPEVAWMSEVDESYERPKPERHECSCPHHVGPLADA